MVVGATSGIGEAALKEFVRQATKPKCYLVGRSEQSANRIIEECNAFNSDTQIVFVRADVSLVREADRLCEEINRRESAINVLFLSAGEAVLDRSGIFLLFLFFFLFLAASSLIIPIETSEGLHTLAALTFYTRLRMTQLLLPLLQRSTRLARVVNIAGGTKEGPIYPSDMQAFNVPLHAIRGHLTTLISLSYEALTAKAPDVSFLQVFLGAIKTALFDRMPGVAGFVMRCVITLAGKWLLVPIQERGERNAFFSTNGAFPARYGDGDSKNGVEVMEGLGVARGTDGNIGSGVYSVDYDGTEAGQSVMDLLGNYREEDMVERVWGHAQAEFDRITYGPSDSLSN